MSDQTPTLADVRERYVQPQSQGEAMDPDADWIVGAEFDRAIAKVRAEAKAEALREAADEVGALGPACIPAAEALRARADKLDTL